MARAFKRLTVASLSLAVCLGALQAAPAHAEPAAAPSGGQNAADAAAAEAAIVRHFDATEAMYTRGVVKNAPANRSAGESATLASVTEDNTAELRATMTSEGLSITATDVETVVVGWQVIKPGKISTVTDVTTTWTLFETAANTSSTSSMTVRHKVNTTSSGGTTTIDSDDQVADAPQETVEPLPVTDAPASTDRSQATAPPKNLAGSASTQSASAQLASARFPQLNYTAASLYAQQWTLPSNAARMNSAYPVANNNCANFVSQALRAGGWPLDQGISPKVLVVWTPNVTGPAGMSRTWSHSGYLYNRIIQLGGGTRLSNIYNAGVADLLMTDWNLSPSRVDGELDHAMIVTGRTQSGMPRVSQKSGNRHQILLSTSLANARQGGATVIRWYGIRT